MIDDENLKQFLKTTILLSSQLDDARLSSSEFRVYAHISRRAGRGIAFPSIDSISKTCRLNQDTVRSALKTLSNRKMIVRSERPGMTTEVTLTSPAQWIYPPENEVVPQIPPPGNEGMGVLGNEGMGVLGNEGRLRRPTEGDPLKETQTRARTRTRKETTAIDAYDDLFASILPESLRNAENLSQWHDWISYRNEHKQGKGRGAIVPLTMAAAKQSLFLLKKAKRAKTIASLISTAISGEWDGLHLPYGAEEEFYK